jgi:hypothetical protein
MQGLPRITSPLGISDVVTCLASLGARWITGDTIHVNSKYQL